MNEYVLMSYNDNNEKRWSATKKFRIIKSEDKDNKKYVVDINGNKRYLD